HIAITRCAEILATTVAIGPQPRWATALRAARAGDAAGRQIGMGAAGTLRSDHRTLARARRIADADAGRLIGRATRADVDAGPFVIIRLLCGIAAGDDRHARAAAAVAGVAAVANADALEAKVGIAQQIRDDAGVGVDDAAAHVAPERAVDAGGRRAAA